MSYYDLSCFDLRHMIECGQQIRSLAPNAGSMQATANILVRYFHQTFADPGSAQSNCVLVRCFKTRKLGHLPEPLKAEANRLLQRPETSLGIPCLTLLASAGDLDEWNDPGSSVAHAVIPLESVGAVERAPMIAQLMQQLGIEFESILQPNEDFLLQADEQAYGVFQVEDAVGSPSIPAQSAFVLKHGVQSVLGFGGLLPSGDLFSIIIFSRVRISREVATLFRTLALSVKLVLLPFSRGPIFAGDPTPVIEAAPRSYEQEQLRSEMATLRLLIPALEAAALQQTGRLHAVISDLNEQREESQKLGARLSSMLESTTDAVFLLDRDWRFTYANRRALAVLERGEDLLGKNIWDEFPVAINGEYWNQYHTAMDMGTPVQFQEHYPEPLDKWFEIYAFPSHPGIAVFFHDITNRRKTEAALMRSEKLAAVGRLAASIAHEINNPLESVTNLLYLARTSIDQSEIRDYLSTADRELRRVGAITSQTLRFHKQASNPTEVTCDELVEDVLSIYHGRIVNSRVRVERRMRTTRPVLCFEGEIRQVLNNLVGNAIDALHPEGGRLLLQSREGVDWRTGRRGLQITVADSGPGMSSQTAAKAMEPFFTTKGIGGSGLGLWISKEITGRHNGRLLLRSSQLAGCSGTVMVLFLPFQAAVR